MNTHLNFDYLTGAFNASKGVLDIARNAIHAYKHGIPLTDTVTVKPVISKVLVRATVKWGF